MIGGATTVDVRPDLAGAVETLRGLHADAGAVSGRGLEALIAGATLGVSKRTWILPGRREAGAALLRGASVDALHTARPYRVIPAGPSPSARAGQAVGIGMAGESALCFLGTGSVAYGTLAEVIGNLTQGVQFVVSWYDKPGPFALPVSPAGMFIAAGHTVAEVDGSDVLAMFEAVRAGNALIIARI